MRELERKLRVWRWGALALAGAALATVTAGTAVAGREINGTEPAPAIPAQSVLLELPSTKNLKVTAKEIAYDHSTRSFDLSGSTRLQWGAGNSLSVGAAYRVRLETLDPTVLDPTVKDGPTRISLTPASTSKQVLP